MFKSKRIYIYKGILSKSQIVELVHVSKKPLGNGSKSIVANVDSGHGRPLNVKNVFVERFELIVIETDNRHLAKFFEGAWLNCCDVAIVHVQSSHIHDNFFIRPLGLVK